VFLNDSLTDPIAYLGDAGDMILEAAGEATCWMTVGNWKGLPDIGAGQCELLAEGSMERLRDDEFVFISHSLGSRIVFDMFQEQIVELKEWIAASATTAEGRARGKKLLETLQNKSFRVYMLANQLPLLDMARAQPKVVGQIDSYCESGGAKHDQRIVKEFFVVAFSDPNAPLSYPLPAWYEEKRMDSRLCPRVVDISVGVTEVIKIFNFGEVAHPVKAHALYDDDPRVIGIIAGGIGNEHVKPVVASECTWLRTRPCRLTSRPGRRAICPKPNWRRCLKCTYAIRSIRLPMST